MKKLLFGCALAAGSLAVPLHASDWGCAPQMCDPCCDNVDFNGFYIGGNLGVASHVAHRTDLDGFFVGDTSASISTISTGAVAGVQVGYDWQCSNRLVGLVADWNWASTHRKVLAGPNDPTINAFIKNELNWFSTFRVRAGLALCDALVYFTGGAAVSNFRTRYFSDPLNFRNRENRWGWTFGGGAECMLGCKWSLGIEGLYLHFSERTRTFRTEDDPFSFSHSDSAWLARVFVNYRFGDLCF